MSAPLLTVDDLTVSVARDHHRLRVVDSVSFGVERGRAVGIVGESGSGKSLTLRAVMALLPPAASLETGSVAIDGSALPHAGRRARRSRRGRMAMVFQDSLSALDPVQTVGAQVAEVPRTVAGASRRAANARALELLGLVGVPDPARRRDAYPHQLSGGLRQRVAIAIALASDPQVLLCDEPTTALDVTVQAQVLDLLDDLRQRLGVAVVFVSHDLAVVRQLCEDVVVMYTGAVVESGPADAVLSRPLHPYTLGLLGAALDLDRAETPPRPIGGSLPDPADLPAGCAFHPRCPFATDVCAERRPALDDVGAGRRSACHHVDRLRAL